VDAEPKSSVEQAQERQVPDELLQKLHAATERFHAAKKVLDSAMDDSEIDHLQGVDRATEDVRAAEREVEQITMQIHGSLRPPPGPAQSH
jgi:hypothetical protein